MTTPAFSAPRHIDLLETAKLIRRHLASTFPGQKFSVRTERFSMGTAVDISWTDGPTVAQVETITDPFASSGFDGSVDSDYAVSSWYCSEHGASIRHTAGTEGQRGSVSSIDEVSCCLDAEPVSFLAELLADVPLHGWLVEVSTPIKRAEPAGCFFSWSNYRSKVVYGDTYDLAIDAALDWADTHSVEEPPMADPS